MSANDLFSPDWTRLEAPAVTPMSIQRRELLDALSGPSSRVIWISAPPGYGKTSLLAQHADLVRAGGQRVSWLSIDESDSDTRRFASHLAVALSVAICPPRDAQNWDSSDPELLLLESLAALSASSEPLTLYLDDCQLAGQSQSFALLATLLRRAPASLRIVAAAQGRPPIPLVQLELKGLVRRLTESDLRFTEIEAHSYLGLPLDSPALAGILEKSQGWPIALQVARSQLGTGGSVFKSELLCGTDVRLARYFSELALSRVPTAIKEFLTDTGVLDRLNGDIADAVRERSDSWSLLEEVEERGLFLAPCDVDGEWFQYHPLFREFLANRARRSDPQRESAVRRRAAVWLARHEAWPEAIQQAMRSGDIDLAAEIVNRTNHLEVMMRFGGSVLAGLDQLPDDHLARYPRLALCVAYAHFQQGRLLHARRLLEVIPRTAGQQANCADRTEETQREVFDALLDMCEDRPNRERHDRIEAHLVRGELDDPVVRGECCVVLMVDRQNRDDPAATLSFSDRLMKETHSIHTPYLDGFGWVLRGMAHMARAELGSAQQCYEQCLDLGHKFFGGAATHTPIAQILLAEALFERDRFSEAARPLELGMHRIDTIYGWYELWEPAILTAAPVYAHVHGQDRALAFLQESRASAQARGLERARMLCDAAHVSLLIAVGQTTEAAQVFDRSQLMKLLGQPLEIRTSRVFTAALLAAQDLATAQGDATRWVELISAHVEYLRDRGLRRRLLRMLLARASSAELLGNADAASSDFREALLLGASRGFVRIFLEYSRRLPNTAALVAADSFDAATQAEARTMLASMRERSGASGAPIDGALLSPRETQVLRLMPGGFTSKEIALRLGVTPNTVKGYRRTLFEKLGVTSRSQAIGKARLLKLLP